MDIQRNVSKTKKTFLRGLAGFLFVAAIGGVSIALSTLEPAAPTVDKNSLFIDEVVQGDLVRSLRGSGSLVPVDIRYIMPETTGRVERYLVEPGEPVHPDTVIFQLSNSELELSLQDARLQLKSAESQLAAQKVQLENELLDLERAAAQVEANYQEALLKTESETELFHEGLISELQLKVSQVRSTELQKLREIEQRRVAVKREHAKTQLDVLQARIEQAEALVALKEEQVKSLQVKAGTEGVLEQRLVEAGHQVATTTILAKVSDPAKLKAVLRIDQNQARDVQIGLKAELDIRSQILTGQVSRIDPAVQAGSVLVDITILDPLPAGARPDLTLFGAIQIETLVHVLHVGRPVLADANNTARIFRLNEAGTEARLIPVQFGRHSINRIEIINGLRVGDRIIVSDMSEWDQNETIQLK